MPPGCLFELVVSVPCSRNGRESEKRGIGVLWQRENGREQRGEGEARHGQGR